MKRSEGQSERPRMADNVIIFDGKTQNDIPVKRVIDHLDPDKFTDILVLGFDNNGDFVAFSNTSNPDILDTLLEIFEDMR